MGSVKVTLKNGNVREFRETRSDWTGSNHVRYEGVFVIVVDVWGNETSFPAADIAEVVHKPEQRGRW